MDNKKKKIIIRTILFVSIIIICVVGTILCIPFLMKLKDVEYRNAFIEKISGMGFTGSVVLVLISVVQMILAFLPGEVLEIIAGIMYGPWFGLLICEIGVTLGSIVIYFLVKFFGRSFVDCFVDLEKYENKWDVLSNPGRTEVLFFSFLLFPGLPKDFIAFLVPFTKVKLHRFLIINAIARIPSILASTYFGGSIFSGNMTGAIIIYGIEILVALICFFFNKQITNFIYKKSKVKTDENNLEIEKEITNNNNLNNE